MSQWIATIIIGLWPILWHVSSPLGKMLLSRLPDEQRGALVDFADIAVHSVEQISQHIPNEAKKQMAMTIIIRLFRFAHRPLPPADILDAAIEAAVNMLPPSKVP